MFLGASLINYASTILVIANVYKNLALVYAWQAHIGGRKHFHHLPFSQSFIPSWSGIALIVQFISRLNFPLNPQCSLFVILDRK